MQKVLNMIYGSALVETHGVRLKKTIFQALCIQTHAVRLYNFALGICVLSILNLLPSCTDEHNERFSQQVPVTFTASVGEATETAVSRASGGSWTAGDKVGVHETVTGELGDEGFIRYVMQDDLQTLSAENEEEALYFPSDGSDVKFIAFYPYNEDTQIEADNTVTYDLTDQDTQETHEAADFLYYKKDDKSYNSSVYAAKLDFDHKLSRIVVNVKLADGLTDDLTRMAMTINNVPVTVTCDLATGIPTAGSTTGDIVVLKPINQSTNVTYQAIIPPHAETDGFNGRYLNFTVDGKTSHTYKLEGDFASGYSYTYDFTLQSEGLVMTNNQIDDWGNAIVAWEGSYWMKLSQGTLYINGVSSGSFTVTTNHPNAPVVTSSYSLITVSRGSATTVSTGVTSYIITCARTSASSTSTTITVMVGSMRLNCSVYQPSSTTLSGEIVEPANCIVLQTGGKAALIPLAFINKVGEYPGVSSYGKPFSDESNVGTLTARAVWVDAPEISAKATSATQIISEISIVGSNGPLSGAYLRVKPGAYIGNAVIAVTSGTTIRWSFHIWVVNATDRATMWIRGSSENSSSMNRKPAPTNNEKRYAFLPMNLGAFVSTGITSAAWSATNGFSHHPYVGMFYQWGRKDPLPNAAKPSWMGSDLPSSLNPNTSVTALTSNTSITGLTTSIQNPHSFCFDTGWRGTINTSGITNNSWGYSSTYGYNAKSPFDPCPAGWRVPPGFNPSTNTDVINAWGWAETYSYHGYFDDKYGVGGYPMSIYGGHYPAAGRRTEIDTFASNSFTQVFPPLTDQWMLYWSAGAHASTNSYCLAFNRSNPGVQGTDGEKYHGSGSDPRWNAMSIRCVTE